MAYLFVAYLLPLPSELQYSNNETTKIYDRAGKLLYEILIPEEGKKTIIPLESLPENLINATLAVEDKDFFSHGAIDMKALLRAIYLNIKEARIVSGGSTISQQLARNLLGTKHERTYLNKLKEAIYAIRIEHFYSKKQILELYLNKIYYGNLAYGAQSASLDYFGKNIYDLDLAEIALIAGLPQSPSAYNPFTNYKDARKRQTYVLDLMLKNGSIMKEDGDSAKNETLKFRKNKTRIYAPHFVQYIISYLEKKYGEGKVHFGGLKIVTALDLDLQMKAEQILSNKLELLKKDNVQNGAMLSIDVETNEILVWLGSKDYFDESIDGAVDMILALRQPGSALKPFNYLAAFMKGYTPATTVSDIYTQFETEEGPYTPKNYDLKFHGLVRLRDSLASSLNIPAVKVLEYVGIANFIDFLRKFGISTLKEGPSHYGLALTLGGGEVRPLDLAGAYSVLANYGVKKDMISILEIKDQNGKILEKNINVQTPFMASRVIASPQAVYQIIDILSDKKARLIGFGENTVLELNRPSAVKTGTTRNFKDNWAVGFTSDFLTLVWVGNADASSMENISGITGTAPIWQTFMQDVLKDKEKKEFPKPEGLKEVEICKLSGLLPTEYCIDRIKEIFIEGTEPVAYDNIFQKLKIDPIGNQIIADDCPNPPKIIEEKIFTVYPPELRRWAMGERITQPPSKICAKQGISSNPQTGKTIEIAFPGNNDNFERDLSIPSSSRKIPFRVNVEQGVSKVIWYLNDKIIGEKTEFPFTFMFEEGSDIKSENIYKIKAVAITANGEKAESQEITFKVQNE